jgi:hypothetical protein
MSFIPSISFVKNRSKPNIPTGLCGHFTGFGTKGHIKIKGKAHKPQMLARQSVNKKAGTRGYDYSTVIKLLYIYPFIGIFFNLSETSCRGFWFVKHST